MLPLADAASVENLRRNSRPVPGQHIEVTAIAQMPPPGLAYGHYQDQAIDNDTEYGPEGREQVRVDVHTSYYNAYVCRSRTSPLPESSDVDGQPQQESIGRSINFGIETIDILIHVPTIGINGADTDA